jgi:hypothetical protein
MTMLVAHGDTWLARACASSWLRSPVLMAFLTVEEPDNSPGTVLADDGYGRTVLTVAVPGRYVLQGSATGVTH